MYFVIFPKRGPKLEGVVLNRVVVLGLFFVINTVSVSDPQRHPYTQTCVRCFPPGIKPRAGTKNITDHNNQSQLTQPTL